MWIICSLNKYAWKEKVNMKKKNILFILTDDQGAWTLNCGGNHEIQTPNLDKIAKMGMRFDNFFCASPVCSPARATIMTGEIPSQHGVIDWLSGGHYNTLDYPHMKNHSQFQSEDTAVDYLNGHPSYITYLKEAGYQCGLSGKWHLGDSAKPREGFDKWFAIGQGGGHYYDHATVEGGVFKGEKRYITDVITEKALEYLTDFSQNEDLFYLSVHYTAPHSPWGKEEHPDEFLSLYENCEFDLVPHESVHSRQMNSCPVGDTKEHRKENLMGYYASITAMDAGVGKLLTYLEEANLMDDTIIIFLADNGMNMGHHGIWGKGNGTYPANMYDTSVKVPFLIYHPDQKYTNVVSEEMASQYDIFQTLLAIGGVPYHNTEKQPGRSLLPHVLDATKLQENPIYVYDEYGKVRMVRTKDWKYICDYGLEEEYLFDLMNDPKENNNLVEVDTDQETLQELRKKMDTFFTSYAGIENSGLNFEMVGKGQKKICTQEDAFVTKFEYYWKK